MNLNYIHHDSTKRKVQQRSKKITILELWSENAINRVGGKKNAAKELKMEE